MDINGSLPSTTDPQASQAEIAEPEKRTKPRKKALGKSPATLGATDKYVQVAGVSARPVQDDGATLTTASTWTEARGRTIASLARLSQQLAEVEHVALQMKDYGDIGAKLEKLGKLKAEVQLAMKKREKPLSAGLMGIEKQGKSEFINSLIGQNILPTGSYRTTWSPTNLAVTNEPIHAVVEFYTEEEFKQRISETLETFGIDPAQWKDLGPAKLRQVKEAYKAEHGYEPNDPKEAPQRHVAAWKELEVLAASATKIERNLGAGTKRIDDAGDGTFPKSIRPFIAIADEKNQPYHEVFAVKSVTIEGKIPGLPAGVVFKDLAGVDAPNRRAAEETYAAIPELDAAFLVKSVSRPSINAEEMELLDAVRTSDPSTYHTDTTFMILTRVDEGVRDNNTNLSNTELTCDELLKFGLRKERIFPTSGGHTIPDELKPELQEIFGQDQWVDGLTMFKDSFKTYLSKEIPKLEAQTRDFFEAKTAKLLQEFRVVADEIRDGLEHNSPEFRKAAVVGRHWNSNDQGELPTGLLPNMKAEFDRTFRVHDADDARRRRTEQARQIVKSFIGEMLAEVNEKNFDWARTLMPQSNNLDMSLVDHRLRKMMFEKFDKNLEKLKQSLREEAENATNELLRDILNAEFKGGSLANLFPEGTEGLSTLEQLKKAGTLLDPTDGQLTPLGQTIEQLEAAFKLLDSIDVIVAVELSKHRDFLLAVADPDRLAEAKRLGYWDIAKQLTPMTDEERMAKAQAAAEAAELAKAEADEKAAIEAAERALEEKKARGNFLMRFLRMLFGGSKPKAPAEEALEVAEPVEPVAEVKEPKVKLTPAQEEKNFRLDRIRSDVERIGRALSGVTQDRSISEYQRHVFHSVGEALLSDHGANRLEIVVRSRVNEVWPNQMEILANDEIVSADMLNKLDKALGIDAGNLLQMRIAANRGRS